MCRTVLTLCYFCLLGFYLLACEDPQDTNTPDMVATNLFNDQGHESEVMLGHESHSTDQMIWSSDMNMSMTQTDMIDPLDAQTNDMQMSITFDQSMGQDYAQLSDMEVCGQWVEEAGRALLPVDVIWVIDSSPSMGEEIEQVQSNLNTFTQRITESGLDIRVVVVASEADLATPGQDFLGVCIPPPLSGADQCPDVDSDRYYHARINVHSNDALERFVDAYPEMQNFLRPYAYKHVVFVTDDNAGWGMDAMEWSSFVQMENINQFATGLQVHSVVDLVGYQNGCIFDDEGCSCGEERGQEYINLSEQTMGLVYSLCDPDWSPLFDRLEQQVYRGSQLACTYAIPNEIVQMPNATDLINVYWSASADQVYILVPQVENAAACTDDVGWYYEQNGDQANIQLCPTSCGSDEGAVRIEFGCMVVKR